MQMLELDALAREFADYQLQPTRPQLTRIQTYLELLLRWNRRLNLTGLREPHRIVRELFCESIYLTRLLPLAGRLLDVGSGAGFPGLALKLVVPQLSAVLLEANYRKTTFLKETIRKLQLSEISVVQRRFEEYRKDSEAQFDLVTTRALAITKPLLRGVHSVLRPGGRFAAFSTLSLANRITALGVGFHWALPIVLPHSRARVVLIGTKLS